MKIVRRYYSSWRAAECPPKEEIFWEADSFPAVDAGKAALFRQLVPRLLTMAQQAEADITIEEDLPSLTAHVMLEAGALLLFPVGDRESFSALSDLFRLAGGGAFNARCGLCRLEVWVDLAAPPPQP